MATRKPKLQKLGTIVAVEWMDAQSMDAWEDLDKRLTEHIDEQAHILTVGIVLRHTDISIIVGRSYNEKDNSCEGTFEIPSGMIKNIKKLPYPLLTIESSLESE